MTLVLYHITTRCHNLEDNLNLHYHEDLKCCMTYETSAVSIEFKSSSSGVLTKLTVFKQVVFGVSNCCSTNGYLCIMYYWLRRVNYV